jgi:N6-adenosine-specific RNA methylase IME4
MTLDTIKALPVAEWAATDCALFLWVTDPSLPQALEVIHAWGFAYKTVAFTWIKTTKDGMGFPIGCGYWTRANPEQCLLATKGHPQRFSRSIRQLIIAPRREHSRKPDDVYERIEALVAGPYVELFARSQRPGWESWGIESAIGPQPRRWPSANYSEGIGIK